MAKNTSGISESTAARKAYRDCASALAETFSKETRRGDGSTPTVEVDELVAVLTNSIRTILTPHLDESQRRNLERGLSAALDDLAKARKKQDVDSGALCVAGIVVWFYSTMADVEQAKVSDYQKRRSKSGTDKRTEKFRKRDNRIRNIVSAYCNKHGWDKIPAAIEYARRNNSDARQLSPSRLREIVRSIRPK
jgi:hypothetical protein